MKLYRLGNKKYYQSYMLDDSIIADKFKIDDGLMDNWDIKKIKVCSKGKKGDLSFCAKPMGQLILSECAHEKLKDVLTTGVELLPVSFGKEMYYLIHCINILKGIGFEERDAFPIRYRIFDKSSEIDELGGKYVFRAYYSYGALTEPMYTERFVEILKERELDGVGFVEVGETIE